MNRSPRANSSFVRNSREKEKQSAFSIDMAKHFENEVQIYMWRYEILLPSGYFRCEKFVSFLFCKQQFEEMAQWDLCVFSITFEYNSMPKIAVFSEPFRGKGLCGVFRKSAKIFNEDYEWQNYIHNKSTLACCNKAKVDGIFRLSHQNLCQPTILWGKSLETAQVNSMLLRNVLKPTFILVFIVNLTFCPKPFNYFDFILRVFQSDHRLNAHSFMVNVSKIYLYYCYHHYVTWSEWRSLDVSLYSIFERL